MKDICRKTGKCPFTCCLFSYVVIHFVSHTTSDSDCTAFAKNFIHAVVIVMAAIAVDYPLLFGPCMNINIFLFRSNKNNVITCQMLFLLHCRRSHSYCDKCINVKQTVCKAWIMEKNGIESLVWCTLNQQYSVKEHKEWWKKYWISCLVQTKIEIKKMCCSGIRYSLILAWPSSKSFVPHHELSVGLSVNIPLFG